MDYQGEMFPPRLDAVQWVFRYEGAGCYTISVLRHHERVGWEREEAYYGLAAAELLQLLEDAVVGSLRGLGAL